MKRLATILAVAALLPASGAFADETCQAQAGAKKLAGAALTSFMGKCERDAKAKCDADATSKKLHGAAETSFTTKCVTDAVGKS